MNEKTVFIFDAEEGMKLSKDIFLEDGHILAPKETVLDMDLISKISEHHILEVTVYDAPIVILDNEGEPYVEEQTYYDKVRNSEQFQKFHEKYIENISGVKDHLNDIVTANVPVDKEELLHGTSAMLAEYTNSLQLFDMLHSMRQFDDLTFVHCVNVSLIASIMGKWLHLPQEEIDVLTLSGLLHDIGKLLIPNEILTKPGKLSSNEFDIMKNHVNLGYEQLKEQDLDIRVKEACLLHHENCNGTGYPFRLKGDRIPPIAKIISIADVYDAMTAARVYRGSICPFRVIDMMNEDAYSKFDPQYLLPFLKNVVSSYIHNDVKLSDGQIGKVVLINDRAPSKPVVQCSETQFIDLSKERGLEITAIL